jgi:hypothetical protein
MIFKSYTMQQIWNFIGFNILDPFIINPLLSLYIIIYVNCMLIYKKYRDIYNYVYNHEELGYYKYYQLFTIISKYNAEYVCLKQVWILLFDKNHKNIGSFSNCKCCYCMGWHDV